MMTLKDIKYKKHTQNIQKAIKEKLFRKSPKSLNFLISQRIKTVRQLIEMPKKKNLFRNSIYMVFLVVFFLYLVYTGNETENYFDSENSSVNVEKIDWDIFINKILNYYTVVKK